MNDMNQYWPNIKSNTSDVDYDSFWEHEWTKHGTCSPLNQTNYFNTTLNLGKIFGTPSIITDNVDKNIPTTDLRTAFGGDTMVSLQCESGRYLSGVFTCWSMSSLDGSPDKQIICPQDVQTEDNCSNEEINIPSFT
jgi:ribonuclease T2